MLAAREPGAGFAGRGPLCGSGLATVDEDEDGESGLKVRRSGGCGQVP
jgi:hypothetical protein